MEADVQRFMDSINTKVSSVLDMIATLKSPEKSEIRASYTVSHGLFQRCVSLYVSVYIYIHFNLGTLHVGVLV